MDEGSVTIGLEIHGVWAFCMLDTRLGAWQRFCGVFRFLGVKIIKG